MPFELTILGSNSAVPAHGRHPSAQILNVRNRLYMIDCGEGTQSRLTEHNVNKRQRIEQIFISHLHGDHVFGLPGFLTSLSLNNRKKNLDIFSPPGLQEMIELILKTSGSHLSYPIRFHVVPTDESVLVFEDSRLTVKSIPLVHRLETTGYLFVEKEKSRNIKPEKIVEYNIPNSAINKIKNGNDFKTENGEIILNDELTNPPSPPRSFAYCSDTVYSERIIPIIEGVDLLYHETTYMHESVDKAQKYMHSTALEAATIAKKAKVGKLICGHFSTRYIDLLPLQQEARSVFENSFLAFEGSVFDVPNVKRK